MAEPNSTVEILIGDEIIGSATANSSGAWTFVNTDPPLEDGNYDITATATDLAGNTSAPSVVFNLTVDTTTPAAPTISAIIADSGANGADFITNVREFDVIGTAEAGTSVLIFDSNISGSALGMATADPAGGFEVRITLSEGTTGLVAVSTDTAGNSNSSEPQDVTVDTTLPAITSLVLSDSDITDADIGSTVTLTITFDEDLNQDIIPVVASNVSSTLIDPSGTFTSPTEFVVSFTVADANVEVANIQFDVSGATDIAGNEMAAVVNQPTDPPSTVDTDTEGVSVRFVNTGTREDDPGTTNINSAVEFTIDAPSSAPTTITFTVGASGDTADANVDYKLDDVFLNSTDPANQGEFVPASGDDPDRFTGTITIPGSTLADPITSIELDINVIGDLILEGNEEFTITINSVTNTVDAAIIGTGSATATILDNEEDSVVSLVALDSVASEAPFQFPPVDETGNSVFNADIVANGNDSTQVGFELPADATSGPSDLVYQTEDAVTGW